MAMNEGNPGRKRPENLTKPNNCLTADQLKVFLTHPLVIGKLDLNGWNVDGLITSKGTLNLVELSKVVSDEVFGSMMQVLGNVSLDRFPQNEQEEDLLQLLRRVRTEVVGAGGAEQILHESGLGQGGKDKNKKGRPPWAKRNELDKIKRPVGPLACVKTIVERGLAKIDPRNKKFKKLVFPPK